MTKINFWATQSLEQLKIPIASKIALTTSYYTIFSKYLVIFFFIYYQFQILLLAIKPAVLSIQKEGMNSSQIAKSLHDTLFLEDLNTINGSSDNIMMILATIGLYLLLNILIVIYIIQGLYRNRILFAATEKIWNGIVFLHHHILFYPIHIFCVKVLSILFKGSEEEEALFLDQSYEQDIKIACFVMMLFNFMWSFLLILLLKINVKTKSFLSTKTHVISMLDLAFRVGMPFAESFMAITESSTATLLSTSLVYCILRDCLFFHFLPYYKIPILKISALSQAFITSFSLSAVISRPISHDRSYAEFSLLFPMWTLFFIVLAKIYIAKIDKILLSIFQYPYKITNPYHLVHFSAIYKAFSKSTAVGFKTTKTYENYLHYMALIKQSELAYLLPEKPDQKIHFKTQEFIDRYFMKLNFSLLDAAIKRNPELGLLKTTLAHYYAKYDKLYVLANQFLDENLSSSFIQKNEVCLIKVLILEDVNKLKFEQENNTDGLRADIIALNRYIQLQHTFRELKKSIIQQLKVQTQYWKQFQSLDSKFISLVNIAKQIHRKSKQIKNTTNYRIYQETGFAEPMLIYSLYSYFVQNDFVTGQKFLETYQKLEARKKQNTMNPLTDFKITDLEGSIYFILSATGDKPGTILNCSGQANKVFGIPKQMLVKNQMSILMPQIYGKWYDEFIRNSIKSPESKVLDKIMEVPILMKNGFIVSHWVYLTLTYLKEYGLCYSGLIGPLQQDDERFVIVTGDGQICNFSKEFAEDMEISFEKRKKVESIFSYCPLLEGVLKNMKIPNERKLLQKKNSLKNNDSNTLNNHTPSYEATDNANNFIKEIYLVFFPYQTKQKKYTMNSAQYENRKLLLYKTQIKMRVVQEIALFEIKMEKIDNQNEHIQSLSLNKNSTSDPFLYSKPEEKKVSFSGERETTYQYPEVSSPKLNERHRFSISRNESKNEDSVVDVQEPTSAAKSIGKKREKNDLINKYDPTVDTNETPTHILLTSPMSETKKLIQFSKEEDYMEAFSNGKEISQLECSTPFSKKKKEIDKKFTNGYKRLQTNLIKEALGKEKESLEKEMNFSFSNLMEIDSYKITRRIIESKRYQNSSLAYILSFIVAICTLMSFLIWLNFNTSQTSTVVGDLGKVIQGCYFRSFWAKTAIYDMMFWVGVKGTWIDYDVVILQETFTQDFSKLNRFNQNLRTYLSRLDYEIQEPFYAQVVPVYERDKLDNLRLVAMDDTFGALKKIINYGVKNAHKSNDILPETDFIDYDTKFIYDNMLNSLMEVSERLTANVEALQIQTIENSKQLMLMAFSGTLAVLILFIFVSLWFVIFINRQSTIFMNILLTLPSQEITKTEYFLSNFMELLEKDSPDTEILSAFNLDSAAPQAKTNQAQQTAKNYKKMSHNTSMKAYNARNYFVFFGLFACLGLVIGFMIIYYQMALNKILVMERQQTNLNSALNVINAVAYVIPALELLTLTNATGTIKNIPVLEYIKDNVHKISRVSDFQASLKDSNGEFSATQKEILFSYSCTKSYSPLWAWSLEVLQPECEYLSDGLNYVGLFKLITRFEASVSSFVDLFESRTRDLPTLKERANEVIMLSFFTDISFVLLFQLFTDSTDNFHTLVLELEDQRVLLAWVACIVSVALGAMTWIFIVRKLSRRDFQRKKMLALVPNRLISDNFLLKKYVSKLK